MPQDEHLIGQTYEIDGLGEEDKPTIFLINSRIIHVANQKSNGMMTYQEIMDFVTGDYVTDSKATIHIEPRISILGYVGRFIWVKVIQWAMKVLGEEYFKNVTAS